MPVLDVWLGIVASKLFFVDSREYDLRRLGLLSGGISLLGRLQPVECCRFIAKVHEFAGLHFANRIFQSYSDIVCRCPSQLCILAKHCIPLEMPCLLEICSDQYF